MPVIQTENEITFTNEGKLHTVHKGHPKYSEIVSLVYSDKPGEAAALVDVRDVVKAMAKDSPVEILGSRVTLDGKTVPDLLAERIIRLSREGYTIEPLVLFMRNLWDNPSHRAVNELYGFLEVSRLPITDDGHFLAYKSVTQDFKDHHTKQIDNSPGAVVTMPRNQVNEDKDQTCSHGLHFAAHEYAERFRREGRMVVLKINPKDVVSIPSDYKNQKGRCCAYEVLEEVSRGDTKLVDAGVSPVVRSRYPVGSRVVINKKGHAEYGTSLINPKGVVGTVQETYKNKLTGSGWFTVKFDNGHYNNFEEGTLDVVGDSPYVPQVDNYSDRTVWSYRRFQGKAKEFPVNRDVSYLLRRKATGKIYESMYFVNYDEKHDNLVFKSFTGTDFRFCTISDVKEWEITHGRVS